MDIHNDHGYTAADMSPHGSVDLRWLAERLNVVGYTAESVSQRLGIRHPDDVGALNHAPKMELLRGDRAPLSTLIRLLFLESEETGSAVDAALGAGACKRLATSSLLRRRGTKVCVRLRLETVGDQYFLADRRFRRVDRMALRLGGRDPVYPPSSDSLLLREIVAAHEKPSVLDLCCGSGVQGLALAQRASRVVAVDLNPRAAAVTRLNAQLNGIDQIEVHVGDLFKPLRGRQFDVIIANPPFVSSPYEHGPGYHAGGATGDRVLRRVVRGYTKHLSPGGHAFAISHVGLRRGEALYEVAQNWFADFPGRVLILTLESGSPIDLAAAQAQFAFERGARAYAAEVRRWVDYLRRHRIDSIVAFLLVAQRNGRPHVEVVDGSPRILPLPLSPAPAQRVADWLAVP
ncbi:MAG TPA: methyltransferase [Candidatus Acidoferrales bacterium]|nr:methyltransferase [Candidatus Acidoferrales bacterium]